MSMVINEGVTLNGSITVPDPANANSQLTAMVLSATINQNGGNSISININTTNPSLLTSANAATVQSQYQEFYSAIQSRAAQLGYIIFPTTTQS
jgi:hypothetical protein